MEIISNVGIKWIYMVVHLLLIGQLMPVATLQFANIGEKFHITCPDTNVDSWQKLDTLEILAAACEDQMPETVSHKISVSENCLNLTINDFTEKDAGIYRCYVMGNDTKAYNHDFEIRIRINVTRTRTTLSKVVEDSDVTNPTPTENNRNDNFTQTRIDMSESVDDSEITNPTQTEHIGDEIFTRAKPTLFTSVEDSEITNIPPTVLSGNGLLVREIVIYTVVVACLIVILGLSYLVQKYKKNNKHKLPAPNTVQNIHAMNSLDNSDLGIYDEIDETMLLENVNINKVQVGNTTNANGIQIITDNTSYLYPIHSEEERGSSSVSVKSLTRSYLSFHESDQYHDLGGSDQEDDTTSYLHPYHSVDEQWKEKTNKYDVLHASSGDTDSSESSKKLSNDGYLNPYQPLTEGWKQTCHGYETSVKVHQCLPILKIYSSSDEESIEKNMNETQNSKKKHTTVVCSNHSQSSQKNNTRPSENSHKPNFDEDVSDRTKPKQSINRLNDAALSVTSEQISVNLLNLTNDTISVSSNDDTKNISESIGSTTVLSTETRNKNNYNINDVPGTPKENEINTGVDIHV